MIELLHASKATKRSRRFGVAVLALTFLALANVPSASAQQLEWVKQFGSTENDDGGLVATAGANVYVAGYLGDTGSIVVKDFDANGNVSWTQEFGTPENDSVTGIAADSSGVYVTGWTLGTLAKRPNRGETDTYVRKYDPAGNKLWTKQFGTPSFDEPSGAWVNAGMVYVAGTTDGIFRHQTGYGRSDGFVAALSSDDGTRQWTTQFGTQRSDQVTGVAADAAGIFVCGYLPYTEDLDNEAFLDKLSLDGTVGLTKTFGTPYNDYAQGITNVGSEFYVVGSTGGVLKRRNHGLDDAFIRQYHDDGRKGWTRQFGTRKSDGAVSVASALGGIVVGGNTEGTFKGESNQGGQDVFLRKFGMDGTSQWTSEFGTSDNEYSFGQTLAGSDSAAYLGGSTSGEFPGESNQGSADIFLSKTS